jgi:tRNA-specific 2-thiouridylase
LIKFDVFLQKALELGFDGIATGHYARIEAVESLKVKSQKSKKWLERLYEPERLYRLLRGKDYNKDQSYFLSWLNQFQLSKSIFPLGDFTKPEIRAIAEKIWLPNAKRKDSQWLCFIGNIPIKSFLEQKLPKKEGKIINHEGKIIGKHDGARFFTLGQRRGLNLLPDHYVTKIDVKNNEITVGPRNDEALNIKEVHLEDRHWIGEAFSEQIPVLAKIRYRQSPQKATLVTSNEWRVTSNSTHVTIIFDDAQRSVTPGQVAVAYLWEECLGNWIIQ